MNFRSTTAKRRCFNRAILMMPSSLDHSSSTVDSRLPTASGAVRCGYRVTDTTAVSCYYPPSLVCDKLYDAAATACQGRGSQGQLRCHHQCQNHQRRGSNRKSSARLLSRDGCGACEAAGRRTISGIYHCAPSSSADEDGYGAGVIGSAVDLVAETACATIRNSKLDPVSGQQN
jgi:hypothetical protein